MLPIHYMIITAGGLMALVALFLMMRGINGVLRGGIVLSLVFAALGGMLLLHRTQPVDRGPVTVRVSPSPGVITPRGERGPGLPPRPPPAARFDAAEQAQRIAAEAAAWSASAGASALQLEFHRLHGGEVRPAVPAPMPGSPVKKPASLPLRAVGFILAGVVVTALLFVGYLFVDAGTRGQFSWLLRVMSVIGFVGLCVVVAIMRHRL